jgi:hypothetical protein
MPDFLVIHNNETGEVMKPEVVQVWCDPKHPDAHRDPALRAYLGRRHLPALVRYDSVRALILVPPWHSPIGEWEERGSEQSGPEHSALEVAQVLGHLRSEMIE